MLVELTASMIPSLIRLMTHSPVLSRFRKLSFASASGHVIPRAKIGGSTLTGWKKLIGARFSLMPSLERVEMKATGRGTTVLTN
jgi:hypothetical protein